MNVHIERCLHSAPRPIFEAVRHGTSQESETSPQESPSRSTHISTRILPLSAQISQTPIFVSQPHLHMRSAILSKKLGYISLATVFIYFETRHLFLSSSFLLAFLEQRHSTRGWVGWNYGSCVTLDTQNIALEEQREEERCPAKYHHHSLSSHAECRRQTQEAACIRIA